MTRREAIPPPLSVLDIFKIGIGPSSSHTMGPWRAARHFVETHLQRSDSTVTALHVELYGSLAKTGEGHGTVPAVLLGLSGCDPLTVEPDEMVRRPAEVDAAGQLELRGGASVPFTTEHIRFRPRPLPAHANGLRFVATLDTGGGEQVIDEVYYSVGGGQIANRDLEPVDMPTPRGLGQPVFTSAAELLARCSAQGLGIADVVRRAELAWRPANETSEAIRKIADTMLRSVHRGCHRSGRLPGGLSVQRRASPIHRALAPDLQGLDFERWLRGLRNHRIASFDEAMRWLSCAALAVNEENASSERIVTAPTNGSAGVIPAVLVHVLVTDGLTDDGIERFLLVASEIGALIIRNATISAAEGGCQAEIGSSSAMAAAALADAKGASPEQALMAAEIALEHHLGMTCDPVAGLVQVPCIERNVMGATKAVSAATLALHGDPNGARVSFDEAVTAMWTTAQEMSTRYKETSEGGLAVHVSLASRDC